MQLNFAIDFDLIWYDTWYDVMIWNDDIIWYDIWCDMRYDMNYLLIAVGLTPVGSSTIHILHTNNTQNNTMEQNTQNETYITIRIHKHKNKNT